MQKPNQFVGLCVTCDHAAYCTYRSLRGTDAICCDLFDDRTDSRQQITAFPNMTESFKEQTSEAKGLCVNCLHNDTCQLSNREGGIWHCEEYE